MLVVPGTARRGGSPACTPFPNRLLPISEPLPIVWVTAIGLAERAAEPEDRRGGDAGPLESSTTPRIHLQRVEQAPARRPSARVER